MAYKRRLRLLLVAPVHPEWAEEARATAARIGADHIEPRAVPRVGRRETEWADLILSLEPAARDALPGLPPRIQVRHLELPPASDFPARKNVIDEHLRGILGGLRLLARCDEDD